ncbi:MULTISPECIES: flavin reductase family protein [Nocardioides]|uniref:flavin reductase family protein n=1 Tax=Nocardioides TaxID=1839 RepID=UPI00032F6838|nr:MULTISPECIES: flavin reductase family protein [Nocardioides]EON23324.1 flavin reductase domain-containing protein [Nocardioides sp. CF8]
MTIHSEHPFATPAEDRDAARRLRGRLGGQVSLWTTGAGAARAGLTVSSLMVAVSEPSYVVGLLDPDSDLAERLRDTDGARCVVQLLEWRHHDLAEKFAGQMPAPGGLFAADTWVETPFGPRLADAETWADCVVHDVREIGWSIEVTCRIESASLGILDDGLQHRRGRYSH